MENEHSTEYKGLISKSTASRFESLGINCEFGFVIRQLGYEIGSLFRWTSAPTENVLSALSADFSDIYNYENLVPKRRNFVLDLKFGIGWHTAMQTGDKTAGSFEFVQEDHERRNIHTSEKRKVHYLLKKFLIRIRSGGVIYIIKSNCGLCQNIISSLRQELSRLSQGAHFWVAVVKSTSDQTLLGTVHDMGDNLFEGYISNDDTFEATSQPQMSSWVPIIYKLLEMAPYTQWEQTHQATEAMLSRGILDIGFPDETQVSLEGCHPSGPGYKVDIINPSPWSRICHNKFRMHASQPGDPETKLCWFDIELSGRYTLVTEITSPVRDSINVDVQLIITTKCGRTLAQEKSTVASTKKIYVGLDFEVVSGESIIIELIAKAQRKISNGERAVIDITPVSLVLA